MVFEIDYFLQLEKTEKHQENEVNDEDFNWNNVT